MTSRRVPLFSVSIAFAIGCVLGLDGRVPLAIALPCVGLSGLLWILVRRHERSSLAAFYILTLAVGWAHTLLVATTFAPADLRRLPDAKTYPTTQWRGIIFSEPVAQVITHTARRALDRTSFVFRVQAWRPTNGRYFSAPLTEPWQAASGDIECTLVGPASGLACGDQLEFASSLFPFEPPLVPGALDYRAYEAEQGIFYRTSVTMANLRRTETGGGNWWQNLSFRARDWAYARLQIGLEDDPRIADFLAGMIIGYRQQIPADIEQDFRRTGTLHVFAVSGQNIAELMVVALVLLQLFGFVRWRWAWTLAPVILLYCLLTGSPASAVRATLMILAILLAWRLGRPLDALGCWSLAFLAMLIWNPAILLDPGAQLSLVVVLGLILLGPPLMRAFRAPFARDPFLPAKLMTPAQRWEDAFWHHASQLLGATVAATLVSEPITAIDFHQITPIGVLANLVVVPAAGLITIVGTLSITCSLLTTTWAAWLNNVNWLVARLLIAFVGFLAHKPGASVNVPDVRARSPLPEFIVAPLQDSACLLARTSSQAWLFNTGREVAARSATSHLLQFYGINSLDGLALLQVSAADNSGADVIVRDFHPRQIAISLLRTRSQTEKMLPGLESLAGQNFAPWQQGRYLSLGSGVEVDVLNPRPDAPAQADARSLVLLFRSGQGSLLWAGRIGPDVQQALLLDHPGLHADVLVMDSAAAPTASWLKALHVHDWLQFPHRDRQVNTVTVGDDWNSVCHLWPLDQTGAVQIHFLPQQGPAPAMTILQPWAQNPPFANDPDAQPQADPSETK